VKLIFHKKLTRFVDATPHIRSIETVFENVDTRSAHIGFGNDTISMPPL